MSTYSMRQMYGETLIELGQADPRIVALDGDLAGATKSILFQKVFPERFFQCGIGEQNMMSVAVGLALSGKVPFVSSIAVFLVMRACDQMRTGCCIARANVKICGHYGGLCTAENGSTHQIIADLGITRSIPQLAVLAPSDAYACRGLMHAAARHEGAVYLRVLRDDEPVVHDRETAAGFHVGGGFRLREGSDVSLLAHGFMVHKCMDAAEILARAGISASVLDMYSLKPVNEALILEEAERTGALMTVEEHNIFGGLGSAVAEVLSERRPTPLCRHGMRDHFGVSGKYEHLLEAYGLTPGAIAERARGFLREMKPAVCPAV